MTTGNALCCCFKWFSSRARTCNRFLHFSFCDLETRASSIFGAVVWPFSNPERKSLNETYLSNIAAWGSRGHSAPLSLDYCCLSNQPTSNRKWKYAQRCRMQCAFHCVLHVSCCISLRVSPRVSLRYTAVRVSLALHCVSQCRAYFRCSSKSSGKLLISNAIKSSSGPVNLQRVCHPSLERKSLERKACKRLATSLLAEHYETLLRDGLRCRCLIIFSPERNELCSFQSIPLLRWSSRPLIVF